MHIHTCMQHILCVSSARLGSGDMTPPMAASPPTSPKSCLAAWPCATAEAGDTPPSTDVAVSADTGVASSKEPTGASGVVQVMQSSCWPERCLQDLPATDSSSRSAKQHLTQLSTLTTSTSSCRSTCTTQHEAAQQTMTKQDAAQVSSSCRGLA